MIYSRQVVARKAFPPRLVVFWRSLSTLRYVTAILSAASAAS